MYFTDFTIPAAAAHQADLERAASRAGRRREAHERRAAVRATVRASSRAATGRHADTSVDGATAQVRLRPRRSLRLPRLFGGSPTTATTATTAPATPVR